MKIDLSLLCIFMVSALLLVYECKANPSRVERAAADDTDDDGMTEKFSFYRKTVDGEREITVIYRRYKDGVLEETKKKAYPLPAEDSETIKEIINRYKEEIRNNEPHFEEKYSYIRKTVDGERRITVIYRLYKDEEVVEKKTKTYPLDPETKENIKAIINEFKEMIKDEGNNNVGGGGNYPQCLHPDSAIHHDNELILFQGKHYFKVNDENSEVGRGLIGDLYKELPWDSEAATSVGDKIIFFQRNEHAVYENGEFSVSNLPSAYETPIDAVASHDDTQYFFSRCDVTVYDSGEVKTSFDVEDVNLPCDVDAAWSDRESGQGSMTVLRNGLYWVWASYHSKAMGPFKANDVIHLHSLDMCVDNDDQYADAVSKDSVDDNDDTRVAPEIVDDDDDGDDEDFLDTDDPTADDNADDCIHPDAATHNGDDKLFLFQGDNYYMINNENVEEKRGKISDLFGNLPWHPMASISHHRDTRFFNGNRMATSSNDDITMSDVSNGDHIDAVATHDDLVYFISGCNYNVYEGDTLISSTDAKKLNLPCDVDAAWSDRESGQGSMTVLRGGQYWVWPSYYRTAMGPINANNVFHMTSSTICS